MGWLGTIGAVIGGRYLAPYLSQLIDPDSGLTVFLVVVLSILAYDLYNTTNEHVLNILAGLLKLNSYILLLYALGRLCILVTGHYLLG